MNNQTETTLWDGAYKIPWNDPDFSQRMLKEHLTQNHDMASRRFEWINRQVEWIHHTLLKTQPSDILDLGCGPGLYSHRLTASGHRCRGIDFGPVSIEYARSHNPDNARCEFLLADIREVDFHGSYNLAMVLFGELNVFSPMETLHILRKTRNGLEKRAGRLIVELQTPEAVENAGQSESSEQHLESGLFSNQPHDLRTECRWWPDQQVAVQTYTIVESHTGQTQTYRSTTQAWGKEDLKELFRDAGFRKVSPCLDWPTNTDSLTLWIAETE